MKRKFIKRITAAVLASLLVLASLAACGDKGGDASEKKGSIMWLSNLTSGTQFEAALAYLEDVCGEMGYEVNIVYGDPMNDPQGNLTAVMNGMNSDVKGLIMSQDGGVNNIMDEYPELFVIGYNTDMRSIYEEGGSAEALLDNEKYLGTIIDGYADGVDTGKQMFDEVVEAGYKKVSTITFPGFAYPNLPAADLEFRRLVEEYNATAADGDKIEVVGEVLTLMFEPLQDSYFLEAGNSDLDAIVGLCAGVEFIYPTMKTAMANGTCSPDTKLVTSGFNDSPDIIADIGGEGVISFISISPTENIGYSTLLLIKGIEGNQFSDFKAERVDSLEYVIKTQEDAVNVTTKAMTGTGDVSLAQITVEELMAVESHAELKELFMSEQLTVEALKN